ncbi:MAG: FKBP-type peptidyl-prolyl cis-trans isomerase [Lachnospiraceae bacterium]|nr:FKBP-type peptidyl-prolyl cis-trans isomerase [Lachnospiraceae bacterium]
MKVAVTYDNGNVFQHFGHSEQFKVYEVEDNKIVSSEVIGTDGAGHEALATLLDSKSIDTLICGGIGGGAMEALNANGIQVFSGVSGDCDEAVECLINGELVSGGINCDHHDHDHEEEGCNCGDNEGGCSCAGGCGGGMPQMQVIYEGANAGKTVATHYEGTFNDGTVFDSSYNRGEPLQFVCGVGMMIPGFDKAVVDMKVGDVVNIHLMPEEAYGESDPEAILTLNIAELPGSEDLLEGQTVYLSNQMGQQFPVKVVGKTEETITLDANHEMAGKELNFKIELVSVG